MSFNVCNLKKCLSDEALIIPLEEIQLNDKLNFVEEPVEIMDREVKKLKQSRIPIVKVRWNARRGPEFTWECEDQFKNKYPHLFSNAHPTATSGVATNEAVNTAHGVSTDSTQVNAANFTNIDNLSDAVICAFFASQPNSPQLVHKDLQQIHPDDMKEMDLRWQMAMLTIRAKRGHFVREYIAPRNHDNKNKESSKRSVPSDQAEEGPNYAIMAFSSSSPDSEVSNDSICLKSCLETVELLKSQNCQLLKDLKKYELMILGNFMPPTPDLSLTGLDEFVNESIVENCKAMSSEEEPKVVRKYDDAPSIEEWVSDDKEEDGNPQMDLQDQGVINSGCSRHMTWNMSYLTDYEEIDEGYVAFGGIPKGGKITGKCTIKIGNLHFENGKQYRASCKSKTENSIGIPLHLLLMDLFGPTFVKSLKKKMYCLVVTDDYNRFTWVFFLATKDETSGILKSFITGIENLVDHKVKVIRCDNGVKP
ncbi:retrovirus-related pol polyprotein from transposon TNT 1-94 [Tanacetum coccineum]|uniref:Retrovirus-related pol polyprotein from transposon TNT 1-94 n=1 Tax=Tanacetum coccineum TaxID=301880 RepID=A0ABQ4Y9F4_9ASTR